MKRTAATSWLTSPRQRESAAPRIRPRRLLLFTVLLGCSLLAFLAGRQTATTPSPVLDQLQALKSEIHRQQGIVDRLRVDNQHNMNALAARLAELQAASTRIDALGERLAQMGQLSLDEFDFSEPAPVGGPAEYETRGAASESDLRAGIQALSERLRRQSTQLDALQFLMVNRQLENDLTPSGWPVRKGWISSRFGERNDPFTGERVQHLGLDFAGTRGTDVLSVASGVVIWSAARAGYGNLVEIDHGNGFRTRYAHNEKLAVQAGDLVTAGQVIAHMGSSGRASAPHVHFEVLKHGTNINPTGFVRNLR
jgi:murein DD-endopeptidase MepM/ murein hydrolase activator NlpD